MSLCQCGCGRLTSLSDSTNARRGYVKGEPHRFVPGHHRTSVAPRRDSRGYVKVWAREHPRAESGRVFEHIIVAERALGKFLQQPAQVHHVNGDTSDNRPSNLVICQDRAYHALLHRRLRALRACGNPSWRPCGACYEYDDIARMAPWGTTSGGYAHKACVSAYWRKKWAARRRVAP